MTREEKQKAIDALKISAPVMAVTREEFNDYIQTLNKIMDWLEQKPTEWQQDHEILKAYSDGAHEMLDKIRADIEAIIGEYNYNLDDYDFCSGLICARKIIDKYRGESEE